MKTNYWTVRIRIRISIRRQVWIRIKTMLRRWVCQPDLTRKVLVRTSWAESSQWVDTGPETQRACLGTLKANSWEGLLIWVGLSTIWQLRGTRATRWPTLSFARSVWPKARWLSWWLACWSLHCCSNARASSWLCTRRASTATYSSLSSYFSTACSILRCLAFVEKSRPKDCTNFSTSSELHQSAGASWELLAH